MLVTIGIPFRNSEKTLQYAINSVFLQNYDSWELFLVNDGSIDNSMIIAKSISENHPNVSLISDGLKKGLSSRLNQISKLANGKYIARMDSDDIMHPDRIKQQVDFLEKNNNIDIVGTGTYIINENNKLTGLRETKPLNCSIKSVIKNGLYIHPTVMGRKEWFLKNPYDLNYLRSQDLELWCRTLLTSNFGKIELPLFYYRENSKINISNYLNSCKSNRKILKRYGPLSVGELITWKLILNSYFKSSAYWIFEKLSIEHILLKNRNNKLDEYSLKEASKGLSKILNKI